MVKIKVFGKPEGKIAQILSECLKKVESKVPEIYLAVARSLEDWRKYRQKFGRVSLISLEKKERERMEAWMEWEFRIAQAGYVAKWYRKMNIPPVILLKLEEKIPEVDLGDAIFSEVCHLKDEEIGWADKEYKASMEASCFTIIPEDSLILSTTLNYLADFFGSEIAVRYGQEEYVLRRNKKDISQILKEFKEYKEALRKEIPLSSRLSPLGIIDSAIGCAFTTSLPPAYPEKEKVEKELERELSPLTECFPEDLNYFRLKSIIGQVAIPPQERNLLKIYFKVFDLSNDFLDYF